MQFPSGLAWLSVIRISRSLLSSGLGLHVSSDVRFSSVAPVCPDRCDFMCGSRVSRRDSLQTPSVESVIPSGHLRNRPPSFSHAFNLPVSSLFPMRCDEILGLGFGSFWEIPGVYLASMGWLDLLAVRVSQSLYHSSSIGLADDSAQSNSHISTDRRAIAVTGARSNVCFLKICYRWSAAEVKCQRFHETRLALRDFGIYAVCAVSAVSPSEISHADAVC